MKINKMLAATGIIVAASASLIAVNPATAAASGDPHEVMKKHNYVVACNKPGNTTNFSWTDGTVNTRIYYNNHCSHKVQITVHLGDALHTWNECLSTAAGKKSSKEFNHGASGSVLSVSRTC